MFLTSLDLVLGKKEISAVLWVAALMKLRPVKSESHTDVFNICWMHPIQTAAMENFLS